MVMQPFRLLRPTSLAEARTLREKNDEASFLSGGHTLLPTMKQGLARPPVVIDLTRIDGLRGIAASADAITIGATTLHAEVAASEAVQTKIPALAGLAGSIGDRHVRNRGTIGGSLANNDPAADYPAAALALMANLQTSKRTIAADAYFTGSFATVDEDEIITEISFPIPKRFGYAKFPNPASRFALVGVAVAQTASGVR